MITIQQLKNMPVGERVGGFELSIKTYKKTWEANKKWYSQVILMDETGEMPADIYVGKAYNPIRGRGHKIRLIICEVQEAEYLGKDRKKLYISEYSIPTTTIAEYEAEQDALDLKWGKEIQGKIRHGLVCSYIKKGKLIDKSEIEKLIEYIMTGK